MHRCPVEDNKYGGATFQLIVRGCLRHIETQLCTEFNVSKILAVHGYKNEISNIIYLFILIFRWWTFNILLQ